MPLSVLGDHKKKKAINDEAPERKVMDVTVYNNSKEANEIADMETYGELK